MIDQALWFDVLEDDFFGNGRVPNPDWGPFLVRSKWEPVAEHTTTEPDYPENDHIIKY